MPSLRPPLYVSYLSTYLSRRPLHARFCPSITARSCSCSTTKPSNFGTNKAHPILNTTSNDPPNPPIDHRTLAQNHELFLTSQYSPGSPLFLPNGAAIFNKLQAFLRAQYPQFGFTEVVTPTIYKKSLWEVSGHWENYAEDMFSVKGRGASGQTVNSEIGQNEEFGLKPMNCPGHCLLFASKPRSYRELPIRYADFSALHRNEISGALSGLTRVRRFHQDDAHIFCRPIQILDEIKSTLDFVGMVYETFGLGPYKLLLSTRPVDHFMGTVEDWDKAEEQLKLALAHSGREWSINEGDGAFYGPKIDIVLKDSHGKEHQTATIQLDFQLPQRFKLQYQAPLEDLEGAVSPHETSLDSGHARPVIVHRAILGSIERFMALLIEHYAGTYPFWLSPRPAIILSLNQNPDVLAHVNNLQRQLTGNTPRRDADGLPRPQPLDRIPLAIETDTTPRSLGKKIHDAKKMHYNFIIIVGPAEAANGTMKLEMANQPESSRLQTLEALKDILGGKEYNSRGTELRGNEGRQFFEVLMEQYL
ncbi:class II aaRS and biotin synthetase [Lepidopterella palustris CBS 459.81]|uniref:threonine--tRNA ligase n=1 Tax=Lepidopterella palustris CBS 459.81 TaxID=1314670 RepID=A0A8E2JCA5_9PEZI|nr:class II aaRS and biotin synthetase [Lepidopterella palustris CBS 459.81]